MLLVLIKRKTTKKIEKKVGFTSCLATKKVSQFRDSYISKQNLFSIRKQVTTCSNKKKTTLYIFVIHELLWPLPSVIKKQDATKSIKVRQTGKKNGLRAPSLAGAE